MFYFFLPTLISYNFILVIAAVVPAILLMITAYKSDRLEKESPALLWRLIIAGILSSLIALVVEKVLSLILNLAVRETSPLYNILLYFVIVAFAEEGAKYFMLRRRTWRSLEFDCQYDGVVYAVFISLGFALWENISYVMIYGFGAAIIRAITAIPGHACFGIFMGVFYGTAKKYYNLNNTGASRLFSILAVIIPALLHGTYDYIATVRTSNWFFIIFVVVLFVFSFILMRRMSKKDQYI